MNAPAIIPSPVFTAPASQARFRQRLSVAPMTRISASSAGVPGERMGALLSALSHAGGFSLVTTEGIYTDKVYAQTYSGQPGLTDREQADAWRRVVDAVHAAGAGSSRNSCMAARCLKQILTVLVQSVPRPSARRQQMTATAATALCHCRARSAKQRSPPR